MPDSFFGDNWEVEKSLRFFFCFCFFDFLFVCFLRGVDIMFDNNCGEYS